MNKLKQLDLLLSHRHTKELISERKSVDFINTNRDLAVTTGLDNLAQAIINRLQTRQGELANLGHPDYGSRLYQLMGELNNNRTRALAELYIRESLAQDDRIEEVVQVSFSSPERGLNRHVLQTTIAVKPISVDTVLTLGLALNLGG